MTKLITKIKVMQSQSKNYQKNKKNKSKYLFLNINYCLREKENNLKCQEIIHFINIKMKTKI